MSIGFFKVVISSCPVASSPHVLNLIVEKTPVTGSSSPGDDGRIQTVDVDADVHQRSRRDSPEAVFVGREV